MDVDSDLASILMRLVQIQIWIRDFKNAPKKERVKYHVLKICRSFWRLLSGELGYMHIIYYMIQYMRHGGLRRTFS
jgi:hypothetical protein